MYIMHNNKKCQASNDNYILFPNYAGGYETKSPIFAVEYDAWCFIEGEISNGVAVVVDGNNIYYENPIYFGTSKCHMHICFPVKKGSYVGCGFESESDRGNISVSLFRSIS